jgi:Ca2+-binding EF-hand superfamily protein
MNKLTLGGVATAAMMMAAAAAAQPPSPPVAPVPPAPPSASEPQVQIMRIERGAMRTHTREDVVKHVRELFGRLDSNRDGFISRDEADIGKLAMGDDLRKRFAERRAERGGPRPDRGAAFDRLDTNKDGMVSRQEFMSAKPRIEERRMIVLREGPGGEAGGPAKMRMHRMGVGLHGRLFDMADANHDGKVSLQEATGAALRHFDMADANHDGKITPDEHRQMRQKIRIERHPA